MTNSVATTNRWLDNRIGNRFCDPHSIIMVDVSVRIDALYKWCVRKIRYVLCVAKIQHQKDTYIVVFIVAGSMDGRITHFA